MGIRFTHQGSFRKTKKFLNNASKSDFRSVLDQYGKAGVEALASATPVDSGQTAASWGYEIIQEKDRFRICWTNTHENKGVNIAIILQYGHGTGTGGYVQGRDYINPAITPVFDALAEAAWNEVRNW